MKLLLGLVLIASVFAAPQVLKGDTQAPGLPFPAQDACKFLNQYCSGASAKDCAATTLIVYQRYNIKC